ncbi:MAG: Ribosomal large subunit methyltransferase [Hydrocarboniphaga sp.]|uniref:23S rRNA (adenine(2030)-N(6))-methyltransferase RlmJ n=1 Tax=Hydrocarboniphaga sp. TaxID=2033016 RepID=UPI002615271A|nr:23S rRNA (adenine(2030)-N(6))-methyltransferase RlmJ [Hydrocarboniphaga sp.]MDB5969623.1 Ribosomal large subunit methyltransferase [Hydrocarboniphaga sp.]
MHYRHHYHAGNFADVLKHALLTGLLAALNAKDKPWFFLDTHAGAGRYDLRHAAAETTAEWRQGIGRLLPAPPAASLKPYLDLAADTAAYPGSPLIAARLARPGDRMLMVEKVTEVADLLEHHLRQAAPRANWTVLRGDGYESAAASLPPAEKRGLVLIDPPFEALTEFDQIGEFLQIAQTRFVQGQYLVWYPVKKRFETERFLRRIAKASPKPALDFRFDNGAPAQGQMHVCGVLVLNPPWKFEDTMKPALDAIARGLAQGPKSTIETRWIKTEAECLTSK